MSDSMERWEEAMSDWKRMSATSFTTEDAADRRAALEQAVQLFDAALDAHKMTGPLLNTAEAMYQWLRRRPSLRPARLVLKHGRVENQPGH